jgi:hypothetical protein
MSGYVPNDRNVKKESPPSPYNGNFDQQAPRPLEASSQAKPACLVGMRFIWDNDERLPANTPYLLAPDQGAAIQGGLDARGGFIQSLQASCYQVQLLANSDVDTAVASARAELQATLEQILSAERAEAAQLRRTQEQRSALSNYLHTRCAFGKGFFLGAWGLLKSIKEMSDLVNPYNHAWNMLSSAWKAKVSPQGSWYDDFLQNYSQAQHQELVEALGFDPSNISREQIAQAYEAACFIHEDGPSKQMLGRFAMDYAKAQNVEELAEFGGGAVFELVLAALLVVFTGGIGLAARGAASVRHAALLQRLGSALQRLSGALKNAKIKLKGRAQGRGTSAQTVEVPRPAAIPRESLAVPVLRSWSHLTLSDRHFPHRVTIPKKTGNTMYTVPPEVVAKDLDEIHRIGEQIRTGESFSTSSGRTFGIHDNSLHPVSGPGTVNITSAEYNILVTARKKGMDNARKSLDMMSQKGIFTAEQKSRTSELLDLMQARGIK